MHYHHRCQPPQPLVFLLLSVVVPRRPWQVNPNPRGTLTLSLGGQHYQQSNHKLDIKIIAHLYKTAFRKYDESKYDRLCYLLIAITNLRTMSAFQLRFVGVTKVRAKERKGAIIPTAYCKWTDKLRKSLDTRTQNFTSLTTYKKKSNLKIYLIDLITESRASLGSYRKRFTL